MHKTQNYTAAPTKVYATIQRNKHSILLLYLDITKDTKFIPNIT